MSLSILWLAGAVGLYMAWNIGANDVANAMGTSVGAKALTLRQAILIAGLLEFAGATVIGCYVTDTVRKGIVDPAIFASQPQVFAVGMTAALVGASFWLNLATYRGWPVSTTHSIVGAVAGFGLVVGGSGALSWGTLGTVAASWVVSPVCGGLVAYLVYRVVLRWVIQAADPAFAVRRATPLLVSGMTFVLVLALLFDGLKNLKLSLLWWQAGALASGAALAGYLAVLVFRGSARLALRGQSEVERIFRYLQIASASFVAFAHGANDVANAVGPLAAVLSVVRTGNVDDKVAVPTWVLAMGGAGIVVGLASYGYKVMATVGQKITEITPSRGFAAEFGAALTILVGSKLGLPLSTTHTLVGAVIGVGFARGMRALNLAVVHNIFASWVLTIPCAAVICVVAYWLLRAII